MAAAESVNPGLTADCVGALTAYQPDDPAQRRLRDEFIDHLRTRTNGWSRTCPGAHVTASAIIATPTADQVLLIRHAKLSRWLQTGGHIEDADVSLAEAALREAREESGLSDLEPVPGVLHLDRHKLQCGGMPTHHLDVRHLILSHSVGALPATPEATDVRWFAAGALPTDEVSVTVLVDLARHRLT
ncbi:MAG TPA: NUDIX domain-containing protein [Propionibacterium sp.]|jgi:8-oxo-dGTP pyrophosphatase MutT (NUDIX family)|nr:NUDIX domain-containing protein [Propionibacterium sp.]